MTFPVSEILLLSKTAKFPFQLIKLASLQAANGASIATFCQHSLTVNLGLRHPFWWIFTIADDKHLIVVGADFLGHHTLLVDVKNKMLIESTTNLQTNINLLYAHTRIHTVLLHLNLNPFFYLLLDFPELTRSFSDTPVKHDVIHHIETSGPHVSSCTQHLPPEHLAVTKFKFEHMMN